MTWTLYDVDYDQSFLAVTFSIGEGSETHRFQVAYHLICDVAPSLPSAQYNKDKAQERVKAHASEFTTIATRLIGIRDKNEKNRILIMKEDLGEFRL